MSPIIFIQKYTRFCIDHLNDEECFVSHYLKKKSWCILQERKCFVVNAVVSCFFSIKLYTYLHNADEHMIKIYADSHILTSFSYNLCHIELLWTYWLPYQNIKMLTISFTLWIVLQHFQYYLSFTYRMLLFVMFHLGNKTLFYICYNNYSRVNEH